MHDSCAGSMAVVTGGDRERFDCCSREGAVGAITGIVTLADGAAQRALLTRGSPLKKESHAAHALIDRTRAGAQCNMAVERTFSTLFVGDGRLEFTHDATLAAWEYAFCKDSEAALARTLSAAIIIYDQHEARLAHTLRQRDGASIWRRRMFRAAEARGLVIGASNRLKKAPRTWYCVS